MQERSDSLLPGVDFQKTMEAIAAAIQRIAPNEFAAISLHDKAAGVLCEYPLHRSAAQVKEREISLDEDSSPEAWAFQLQEGLFIANVDRTAFPMEAFAHLREAGIRTGWWLPLNSAGSVIGTLFIGSSELTAFESLSRNTLMQLAAQVALTIEVVDANRKLAALIGRLEEDKRRLEERLRDLQGIKPVLPDSSGTLEAREREHIVNALRDAKGVIGGRDGAAERLGLKRTTLNSKIKKLGIDRWQHG